MVFLTMAEMKRLGIAGKGVDEFYFQKARKENLPVQFLESPREQLRFLADIGKKNEDQMIRYILKDVGELHGVVGKAKTAWRRGIFRRCTLPPQHRSKRTSRTSTNL